MKMNSAIKKYLFVASIITLLLFGCGPNINVKDVDTEYRPPNTGKLDVYNSEQEVNRPHKTIKTIYAEDDRVGALQDEEEMKREVFEKAKEVGADGLIITKTGIRKFRMSDGMGGSIPYNAKFIRANAIIYLDK